MAGALYYLIKVYDEIQLNKFVRSWGEAAGTYSISAVYFDYDTSMTSEHGSGWAVYVVAAVLFGISGILFCVISCSKDGKVNIIMYKYFSRIL